VPDEIAAWRKVNIEAIQGTRNPRKGAKLSDAESCRRRHLYGLRERFAHFDEGRMDRADGTLTNSRKEGIHP